MHNAALATTGVKPEDIVMLILTRRIGETLRIGDDVSLIVLGVQGNQVRIGADAPREVAVHREEIYRRIQQEKMQQEAPPAKVQDEPAAGAKFYSSEGYQANPAAKRAPNIIVKKKRVVTS